MPSPLLASSSFAMIKTRARRRKVSRRLGKGRAASILIFIILLTFFSYLFLSTELVEVTFKLREKEDELITLERELETIESQISSSFSLEELEKAAENFELVQAKDIRYLEFKSRIFGQK